MDACKKQLQLIGAYVDATAGEAEKTALRAHLAECPACDAYTRELLRTRELVQSLPELKPSPSLMPSLSARLREQHLGWFQRTFGPLTPSRLRVPIAVAACLLLAVGVGVVTMNHGPTTVSPSEWVEQPSFTPTLAAGAVETALLAYQPDIYLPAEPAPDEFLAECEQAHEAADPERTYWATGGVMLTSTQY